MEQSLLNHDASSPRIRKDMQVNSSLLQPSLKDKGPDPQGSCDVDKSNSILLTSSTSVYATLNSRGVSGLARLRNSFLASRLIVPHPCICSGVSTTLRYYLPCWLQKQELEMFPTLHINVQSACGIHSSRLIDMRSDYYHIEIAKLTPNSYLSS